MIKEVATFKVYIWIIAYILLFKWVFQCIWKFLLGNKIYMNATRLYVFILDTFILSFKDSLNIYDHQKNIIIF